MNRLFRPFLVATVLLGTLLFGRAATTTLEFHQSQTTFNLQSDRGVPISTVFDSPPGSDGRMPTAVEGNPLDPPPTANQFRGLVSFGGVPGLTLSSWQTVSNNTSLNDGSAAFDGALAADMGLPVGRSESQNPVSPVVIVMRRGQIGAPYLSRQISFAFGSIVSVPATDEQGVLLTGQTPESFWLPQPYSGNNHTNAPYYWSPHARKVYAIQPGPIFITWRKLVPFTTGTVPVGYTNLLGSASFETNGASVYQLYTSRYIVSGSAVKPPRKIYWTEKGYRSLGKPVAVPSSRVGAVNIVFNTNSFPRSVASEFVGIGGTNPAEGGNNETNVLQELRTLWYDQQQGYIYAYNQEGRVFVELLGDRHSDGVTYDQLGTEIVDVFKQVNPADQAIELGERITPPGSGLIEELFPEPVQQGIGTSFAFQQNVAGSEAIELYATRKTANLNDYMVHWLEEGEAGIKWPKLFGRYHLDWPSDVGRYSHYMRPIVATEAEAQATAVVLSTKNVPILEYQDPLDRPRAKLTAEFKFYTFLEPTYPAHRALLRFTSDQNVAFERVFSWLGQDLKTSNFANDSVVTNLTAWNSTNQTFSWPDELTAPRVVNQTVDVGERIQAPSQELGSAVGLEYLAGHLNLNIGTSYDINTYVDPFVSGFDVANSGAIIPVNEIPGSNKLEVWWFRANGANSGPNAGNTQKGFDTIYWPSVIGQYTIQWPSNPREIVLASNLGGTGLSVSEALGTIYFQNDPNAHGYNPNEEHAIMSGGTPFATRDDLNIITSTNGEYSSEPYVLVDYESVDGRPDMSVFKVLREKPDAGYVFDYIVPAGQPLQAPMPLPLLAKPVEGSGDAAINYNKEPTGGDGDFPGGWIAADATGSYSNYVRFTYRDRHEDFWVYRGLHAGLPALEIGRYDLANGLFNSVSNATAVVDQPFQFSVHVSRQDEFLGLDVIDAPAWLGVHGLSLQGTPEAGDEGSHNVQLVVYDLYDKTRVTNDLTLAVVTTGSVAGQDPLLISSTNSYTSTIITYSNRPPFLAQSPAPSNSFTLRYYYKTEPSFAWPGEASPPTAGSIVPYLRPINPASGQYLGDGGAKETAALDIVYRPVWPVRDPKNSSKSLPTLPYGATLARPGFDLSGVRDFQTAHILYQQSIAADLTQTNYSAVLHDPTRQKFSALEDQGLGELPAGVKSELNQGKVYFPNLPPHLVSRLFLDPNRSAKGTLVLQGEYVEELLGESYLQLNALRGSDLALVYALCPIADADYSKWVATVDGLAAAVETFYENPDQPGSYIPNPVLTVSVGVGEMVEIKSDNVPRDSYAISATGPGEGYVTVLESSGTAFTEPGDTVAMHIFKVGGDLYRGELKVIPAPNPLSELVTFQHTSDMAGRTDEFEYEWKIAAPVDGFPPEIDATMSRYLSLAAIDADIPRYTLGGAGIQALGDNYVVMRYRPLSPSHPLYRANPTDEDWSRWTEPALAEGWIKRVLAGINPFNQRITDLFSNRVNTDASLLTQAGRRWEGDVALNLDSINDYGLIEIYETVLRRGRSLSIESGFNYGPANDALLLAAGYLNDLYMFVGNEAWADAANPTIGIGTADNTYGEIATALFSFKGQMPTLLEEELALLRGRDDFFQPGVEVTPVYNRLVWNYTRGIDAGEVIYALNYNILENPDQDPDGIINAEDAARMFPQGHGDAYGHYLTALKGYYSLLMNSNFDWVPRIEAVNVLGKPVSVDYQDERKFASAAAAVARAGQQVFDLTWRKDYQPVSSEGWEHMSPTRKNTQRQVPSTRHWGMDQWASRVGQGTYLNWVVGNSMLPEVDPISTHEGIQKVDRTTVPELRELATLGSGLQAVLENAEGGLSPLGVPEDAIALDIDPNVTGSDSKTHFEQIYDRAKRALNNAVVAFDDAKDVTRLMRSEQDSLADLQNRVVEQELAYRNALIELYGTPYPDDMGPGKTWKQDYVGPDILHYMYVETPEIVFADNDIGLWNYPAKETADYFYKIDISNLPSDWGVNIEYTDFKGWDLDDSNTGDDYSKDFYIKFHLGPHGFFEKPSDWASNRRSPGKIQEAISARITAHNRLRQALWDQLAAKATLDRNISLFKEEIETYNAVHHLEKDLLIAEQTLESVELANELARRAIEMIDNAKNEAFDAAIDTLPKSFIVGFSNGGDLLPAARAGLYGLKSASGILSDSVDYGLFAALKALAFATETSKRWVEFDQMEPMRRSLALRTAMVEIGTEFENMQEQLWGINLRLRERDDAQRNYQARLAEADRILEEREIYRKRAAALVQGYRTRDAAFRIFRNEKLERYKTLFDLAARYALLAANAYDYETGLLDTSAGRAFVRRIVNSRALGVVQDGEPQFAGSNTGDPGLSSALAEMKADWDVVKSRLGFNNPDAYGTTVSLRTELFRILPDGRGSNNWMQVLQQSRRRDLLEDADVRRLAMQISNGNGLPVPGLILDFSTTISDGYNLFGRQLAAGDHAFSPSAFATKIFGAGVAMIGYQGMDDPAANGGAVSGAGGTSPSDPDLSYLDPLGLSATPYVYLIPVGVDSMRSPPLGDSSTIRSWSVNDVAIPMPFNIGASDFSTEPLYQSNDSLTEPLFTVRKHQAFRPVSSDSYFNRELYGEGGHLMPSQYTNNRLVGRSVWNSHWKLVIPGKTLLNDPNEGLERFLHTVRDIKLHFVTYSYSGN